MKKTKKATSIIEAMIVMLIIVTGVTGMYKIYNESIKLSNSIANKITAIQIANQGIEIMTNIRDTNWLQFSSDYENCWNTYNYNSTCIGATDQSHTIAEKSFIAYKNLSNKWILEKKDTESFGNSYIGKFKIGLDSNGIYTQGTIIKEIKTVFTREIMIDYLDDNNNPGDSSDPKIKIISKVQWVDNSSTEPHKIEIEQILTNWKN